MTSTHMDVCFHVCMHVCRYPWVQICMHVLKLYVCMSKCMNDCKHVLGHIYVCTYVSTYAFMNACGQPNQTCNTARAIGSKSTRSGGNSRVWNAQIPLNSKECWAALPTIDDPAPDASIRVPIIKFRQTISGHQYYRQY